MKINSTKKAAILATVLGGFVLGHSAEAANLGVVTASDYVTSHMGAVQGSYINSDDITIQKSVISGLNGDPAVYNTIDPVTGKSSLFIRQYTYSTVNLQNSFAFDAQGDWSNRVAGNTSDAANAHDVARYKDFVYVASYDEGTVGVAQVTDTVISDKTAFTRNMKEDLLKFGSAEVKELLSDSRAALHGEGVVIVDGNLYVVANVNPKGGYDPYSPSYLIKYAIKEDGRLSYDGYTTMGKNTDSVALNVYNNYMLATAIGGYQYYGAENSNADTSIDVVTLNPETKRFMETRQINLPENLLQVRDGKTIPKSEFRSLKVMPNGTAYVMTYNIGRAGKNVDVTVYQTTVSNMLSKTPQNWKEVYHEEAAPGWFGRLDAEYNTKRLWIQVGNKLNIYTDGATNPKSYASSDFATSEIYDELYTWDIIGTDVIPEGNLVKLQLANASDKAVDWNGSGNTDQIKNITYKNIEGTANSVINIGTGAEGNLSNNVLAGIYAEGVSSNVIANNGLQVEVENNIASPVGVYAGNGGSVKFTSTGGDLNVLTKTLDGGNTLTNAIWLDPSKTGGESITLTAGNVNITMEGGYGGNGVAIQKTDRWGENSQASTQGGTININGNLNIKGADVNDAWGIGANPTNVISRFNNAGIFVNVDNSKVNVSGNVDMDVYGNGVTVNGDGSAVTIAKGGAITVPTGTDYGYYTLAAYDGTINMNAKGEANDVVLNGDIFVTKEGTINLGLVTSNSELNGIIDNGGIANLTLKNGAVWTNEANNARYVQDNEDVGSNQRSHVTKLTGGTSFDDAGTIIKTANSDNLYIDTLTGAVKVKYDSCAVDESNVVKVDGGNVTINEATAGSLVGLYTPSAGIDTTDEAEVTAVLNAIANKLYYNGYMQRGATLQGYVTIGEGITSSSITNNYAKEITFTEHGQGTTTGEGTGINPDSGVDGGGGEGDDTTGGGEEVREPFTPVAYPGGTGVQNPNAVWVDDPGFNSTISGTIRKTSVTTPVQIQVEGEDDVVGVSAGNINVMPKSKYGTALNIITKITSEKGKANAILLEPTSTGGESLSIAVADKSTGATVAGDINITMQGGYGGNGVAITKSDGTKDSQNGGMISINGSLNIKGAADNQWGIGANPENFDARTNNSGVLIATDNSTVKFLTTREGYCVDIDVYGNGITVDGANSSFELNGSKGSGSKIVVPKGTDYNYYALAAYDGSISFYSSGSQNAVPVGTQIDGDLLVGSSSGSITLNMKGEESYLNGAVTNLGGSVNLWLMNGANWTNAANNGDMNVTSHITTFKGTETDKSNDGFYNFKDAQIVQTKDSGDVVIDNYSGVTKVIYDYADTAPTMLLGGSVNIKSSTNGSKLTMYTRYSNAITKDNLQNVFNSLANKLYYTGYIYQYDEDGNVLLDDDGNPLRTDAKGSLDAYAQIGEGLTASSIATGILVDGSVSEDIDYIRYEDEALKADIVFNSTTGQGSLTGELSDGTGFYEDNTEGSESLKDANGAYTQPIYGETLDDTKYIGVGVLKNGVYSFTDAVNVFKTYNKKIDGGAYHKPVGVAISSHGNIADKDELHKTTVDMNNNDLLITNTTTGSGASISAVDRGIVEINNVGNIVIDEKGYGPTAGIFANSGGEVYIHNADGGVVTIRTTAGPSDDIENYGTSGACIKTMNGVSDVRSKVVIDGLVDLVADLNTCNNEALSAVASTIEVGGGNIQAINGAWAAIRAYGEFVSENESIVNVNVKKDAEGNIIGAGDYKTTIYGDFVTNGGMGTKGHISVGLNGEGSYWTGNYADNRGYGVTKGQEGRVSLFMKNGATWTGFNDGEMDVTMEGEGTTWYGFNVAERQPDAMGEVNGGLNLTLTDGALWQNAISTEQIDSSGNAVTSKVYSFIGDGGFIDMTGAKTFLAVNEANHAEGSNGVSFKNSYIIEHEANQYQTGDLVINNYSGDTTIIYAHDAAAPTTILGGDTTIKEASEGSKITLSTDNVGIDMTSTSQVGNVLDSLANKLYYTAYVDGERNLNGKVQIAEGLTTSSVGKYVGDIQFSTDDGQGSLKEGSLAKPGTSGGDNTGDNNQGGTTGGGDGEGTVTPETPVVPEEPEEVEVGFNTSITGGSLTEDDNYKEYVTEEGTLDLGSLEGDDGEAVGSVKIEVAETEADNVVISSNSSDANVVIDMGGKELTVSGTTTGEGTKADGISASNGGTVEIKQAGNINIVTNAEKGTATAIRAEGANTNIIIENAELGGVVTLEANANNVKGEGVLYATEGASVKIDGLVDITKTNGNTAINVGKDSKVDIGGGKFGGDKDDVAIKVTDGGSIKINKDGKDHDVVINGKIQFGVKHEDPVEEIAVWSARSLRSARSITVPDDKSYINLTTSGSELNDNIEYVGEGGSDNAFTASFSNGATWTGNSLGGIALTVALDDGGVWTGYHDEGTNGNSALNMTIANGAQWDNQTATAATTVTSLQGAGEGEQSGYIRMSEKADAGLTVKDYSGETTFIYNHDADNNIQGGNVTINKAADGSVVNVRTNSIGTSDKEEVTKVLQALAAKMIAGNEAKDALKGEAQIAEGIVTSASALKVGNINFANGTGELDVESITARYPDSGYIYGDSETAMMKGAKSAMASTVMMWRSESNDILQRMGDLRLATEDSGVWAKYYGGKYEMDAQKTNFTTSYKAYQVGYDKAVGNGWNVGVAVSHNEGDSHYDLGGKGDTTVTSLSVYGNKDYGDGRYLGLIVKGSQLKNEYEVFNNDHYKLEGDYKTWGTSISAEYGKRIEKGNGFYFDPSVELTIGHVQGKDYTATSDMLAAYGKTATMDVEQDSFNSIVGRIGFGVGQQMDKASYYAKLALAHEFGGSFDTHYTAEETKGTSIDFGDTWYEMQIGGTAKLSDNSLLYATYERSFGGDVTEKWRLDAGLRFSF